MTDAVAARGGGHRARFARAGPHCGSGTDLVTGHCLVIHAQIVPGTRPPRELLERIRAGVRAL